ncbi:MAG: tetratricopeptide repeat protein [Spirochaetaceae bacterium]|nr:tetratricopeptide repeat protein [Spirochaetaceae bacterium]
MTGIYIPGIYRKLYAAGYFNIREKRVFLSENKYKFTSEWRRKQKKRKITVFFLIIILVGVSIYFFNKNKDFFSGITNNPSQNQIIMDLWENQRYLELINFSDSLLELNPADAHVLMFRGFASFYEGNSRINREDKLHFIDESIFSLRKALVFNSERMRPQIHYVLGRAYYHKGKYYADLSVRYLEKSIAEGFTGKDTYEYLALAYAELGKKEQSVRFFELAAENNPSDILFSLLAQMYFDLGSFNLAENYLIESNNKTTNPQLEERNLFILGLIFEGRNDMRRAEESYRRIVQINPGSADAFYRLGLLYEIAGDRVRARAEWRNALRHDPQHYGARLKLF